MITSKSTIERTVFLVLAAMFLCIAGCGQNKKVSPELFDPSTYEIQLISSPNGDSCFLQNNILAVIFKPGEFGSEIRIRPSDGLWDASAYRFVRCEIENKSNAPQLVELGFGTYDLTLGGTLVSPGEKKTLKAVIYRNRHPDYIDSLFPVMHGKPDGILRGWMNSTYDSIEYIKLLFPQSQAGASVSIGRIWLEDDYILYTADELKDKFYPFVDRFGQLMTRDWPEKINEENDLLDEEENEKADLETFSGPADWNRYGGWESGPTLNATGRFRVEKYNGKWWLVDPEGKLFWSNGFDCVEFGRQSQTRITGRENYYSYLPDVQNHEIQLYTYNIQGDDTLKFLSFHLINLYRKYGESWKEVADEKIHQRMRSWGFNTIGNWSDSAIYMKRKTPYVLTAYTQKTGEISDPYLTGYQEALEMTLSASRKELDDPWCIGVFIDNELKWGVRWAPKIAEQIMEAPETQPAKIAFRDRLVTKYKTISALNDAWGTNFKDWNQVLMSRKVITGAAGDTKEFMNEFATLYYSVCSKAVKKLAPDLLYLGCRMDFHLYPEDTSLNDIIKIASKYCDVVSFNRYRYTCAELVPPDGGDYPLIIGEYHFGSLETGLLQPGLRYAADQDERAELFGYFLTQALGNPYIIGAHWFQLVDQSVAGRGDGENYQAGFLTVGDVPQQEMISKSREIGYKMYENRINK